MQIEVENTGALERRLTVRLPSATLNDKVRERMQELSRTVRLKGFRPGKVPAKVLEQRFGSDVRREVLGDVIGSSFREAVRQQNLRPAMPPRIASAPESGENIEYTATFEVIPEIGAVEVSAMEVGRLDAEVSDADVDRMIDTLREQRRQWQRVERPAQVGDMVVFEFSVDVDGVRFPQSGSERAGTILGSGALFPAFEALLDGVVADDVRTGELSFPADFGESSLAGNNGQVELRVLRVQTSSLPEIDAIFFSSFGIREGGLERFRTDVRANLERELSNALRARRKSIVIEKLLATYSEFELPSSMVEAEHQALLAQIKERAEKAGQSLDGLDVSAFARDAQLRVRAFLLVDEIARQQNIIPDQSRLRSELSSIASTFEEPEKVIELYARDPQLMSGLRNRILEDQVVEWVLGHAKVIAQPATFAEVMQPTAS